MAAGTSIGLSLIALVSVVSAPADIHVLSAVGMRQVLLELGPKFESKTGYKVVMSFDSGGVIPSRVARGESTDVVLIPRVAAEQLRKEGGVVAGPVDLATSHVAVAVRRGAAKPDISTVTAFKQAMLKAKAIACPDPALGGSSGVHIAKMLERLGIADAVKSKLVYASKPDQPATMPGHLLASGKADIAVHQLQELMAVPGIEIVGPLPLDFQETFIFSAAVLTSARDIEAAKALIAFLRSPAAKAVINAKGMEAAIP